VEMVHRLYGAKTSGDRELWIVPDTDHGAAYQNFPEEYTRRVKAFVGRYIDLQAV